MSDLIARHFCQRCNKRIYNNPYLGLKGLTGKSLDNLRKFYPNGIDFIKFYCQCKLEVKHD